MDQKKAKTIQKDTTWEDTFADLENKELQSQLSETLENEYSPYPTLIQVDSVAAFCDPEVQQGKNTFFIQAPGGSGKTLTFAIPAVIQAIFNYNKNPSAKFHEIKKETITNRGKSKEIECYNYFPTVVILADTKTLIMQLQDEINKCIPEQYKDKIRPTMLFAGENPEAFGQIAICTPTLLNKLSGESTTNKVFLTNTQLFISDEAELVYDSFKVDIEQLVDRVKDNQLINCIFASATLTSNFENFAQKQFYGEQNVAKYNDQGKILTCKINLDLEGVHQFQYVLDNSVNQSNEYKKAFEEASLLLKQVYQEDKSNTQVMIFFEAVRANGINLLDEFKQQLQQIGFDENDISIIHSKLHENKYELNKILKDRFKKFQNYENKILLTTDIMARGIDIDKVALVINFFAPRKNPTEYSSDVNAPKYMHRIARTGRYVRQGISLTYMRPNNSFFNSKDSQLNDFVAKVENLDKNEIIDLKPEYYKEISERVSKALDFNKTTKQEK